MRHRQIGRRLDMDASQRRSLFRNMATSLMLLGQVRTTEPRAKELRRFAERLISIGKRAPSKADLATLSGPELAAAKADRVAAIRRLGAFLEDPVAIAKVMDEYSERFRTRPGGYTRVVKLSRRRPGDNADMAVIQLVESYDPAAAGSAPAEVAAAESAVVEATAAE